MHSIRDLFNEFLSGWIGGAAGLLVGHPMDTIKVRIQTLPDYKGIFDCVISTFRNESFGGFYKGMAFPLLLAGLQNSIYFAGYSWTLRYMIPKHVMDAPNFIPLPFHVMLASVASGICSFTVNCPIDIVKIKLQVQRENVGHFWEHRSTQQHSLNNNSRVFGGPFDCARRIFFAYGLRGFYRGADVMLMRDILGSCLYFPVFELGQQRFGWASFLAGGVAGVVSWLAVVPLDVVKNRMQADDWSKPSYRSSLHCAADSFRREGVGVFFKGSVLLAFRAFPVNAMIFFVYINTLAKLKQI